MAMIKLDQVSKIYNNDGVTAIGIQNVSLEFNLGEFVAITGESGSGKSTLLNVISMMDSYEEGELFIDDKSTVEFSRKDFADDRANYVSFIFQEYNLVDSFTVLDNVMLPLLSRGYSRKEAKKIAIDSIEKVGLKKVMKHKATHLSGGEKQRTVIARALVSNTPIIACDEPTGNLDSETAVQIINLLKEVSPGRLILFVTHDFDSIKHVATRRITMKDSHLESDQPLTEKVEVSEFKSTRKAHTKFPTVLSLGLKDVVSTPKKSFLSLLIAFVISLSSVGILTGAFSLIKPAMNDITTSQYVYADKSHFSNNRVVAFSDSNTSTDLASIDVPDDVFVDYGNVLASQSNYTLRGKGSSVYANLECREINILRTSDELLPKLGKAPTEKNQIALGVSKEKFSTFVTDYAAITFFTNHFIKQDYFNIVPHTMSSAMLETDSLSLFKLYPTGVYLIDDLNDSDYTILATKEGLKNIRDHMLFNYEARDTFTENDADPYATEGIYSLNGISLEFKKSGYQVVKDQYNKLDFRKIYLSYKYEGFDLEISIRGAKIAIPHDSEYVVYHKNLDSGVYIHQSMFSVLFDKNKVTASYYTPNEVSANGVVATLLNNSVMAYRSDTPQSTITTISEKGYQNMLLIVAYAVVFVASSILIAFLGSLILGAIYNSRKKDYAILLSLSYSQKVVRAINYVEMILFFVITSLISYFSFFITSGVLGTNLYMASLENELYAESLQAYSTIFTNAFSFLSSPIFIVIYFVFNILFGVLVSTWIMNKFMKKTLANNLRKGGELL